MTVVCVSFYLFCLLLVGHQVPWCWNVRVFAQDLIMPVCCKRRTSSKVSILIKWKRVVWKIVTLQIKRVVWAATGRLLQHFKLVKDKSLWMVSFGTEQFESKRVFSWKNPVKCSADVHFHCVSVGCNWSYLLQSRDEKARIGYSPMSSNGFVVNVAAREDWSSCSRVFVMLRIWIDETSWCLWCS